MTLQTIGGGHNPKTTPKDTISIENHQQLFSRLAQGMKHGTPGPKKGK